MMGLMIFSNGFFSYMADVETWGRPSIWKPLDRLLATTNSLLQIAIVATGSLGGATFPPLPVGVLGVSVALALACKQRAAAAYRRGDCASYLRWHAAWHYTLPFGAILAQCLLHRPCDHSMLSQGRCACTETGPPHS